MKYTSGISRTVLVEAVAAAALLSGATPGWAAEKFAIDPAHTNVVFLVDHLGYSNMVGQFNDVSGTFTYDPNDPAKSAVEVVIKTASVDTDHEKRDEHLRSPDFFNAAEFPEMTFRSTALEKGSGNDGEMTGEMTLLGVTRPVTLDVTFNDLKPHPLPAYNGVLVAGFSARGTVKRSEFGMKYALGGIGDDISLIIEVEGHKQ